MNSKELADKYVKLEPLTYEDGTIEYNIIFKVSTQEFHISNNCTWPLEEAVFMKDMIGIALYNIVKDNIVQEDTLDTKEIRC